MLWMHVARDVVILQQADGTVDFEHPKSDIVEARYAVLAAGTLKLIHGHVLFRHVRRDHFPVVDEKGRRALDNLAESTVHPTDFRHHVVKNKQGNCGCRATELRC
jgi:hypothetical protein